MAASKISLPPNCRLCLPSLAIVLLVFSLEYNYLELYFVLTVCPSSRRKAVLGQRLYTFCSSCMDVWHIADVQQILMFPGLSALKCTALFQSFKYHSLFSSLNKLVIFCRFTIQGRAEITPLCVVGTVGGRLPRDEQQFAHFT